MKINLNEKKFEEFDEIFDFLEKNDSEWERVVMNGKLKIKTNQKQIEFASMEKILQKFNLRITDVTYTDYYGIIFGIEKLKTI
jgi:acetolactate synthase small subunit